MNKRYDISLKVVSRIDEAWKDVKKFLSTRKRYYQGKKKIGIPWTKMSFEIIMDVLKGMKFVYDDVIDVIAGKEQEPGLKELRKKLVDCSQTPALPRDPRLVASEMDMQFEDDCVTEQIMQMRAKAKSPINEETAGNVIDSLGYIQFLLEIALRLLPYIVAVDVATTIQDIYGNNIITALSVILTSKITKNLIRIINAFERDYADYKASYKSIVDDNTRKYPKQCLENLVAVYLG